MDTIQFENENIEIRGDVDKSTGFIYYTCTFQNGDAVVLSKFDGKVLRFANYIGKNEISDLNKFVEFINNYIS